MSGLTTGERVEQPEGRVHPIIAMKAKNNPPSTDPPTEANESDMAANAADRSPF